ncbi:MAG: TadE/TadG family type IV pilus assembly protein [Parvibaculaceae bacterium]
MPSHPLIAKLPSFSRCVQGVSAIEFALVFPVFVLLLCGMLAFGLYIGTAHSIQQLAADAARASVAGLSDAERVTIATQHVARNASHYMLIEPASVTALAGPMAGSPDDFEVRVRYDASSLPIWQFVRILPLPDETIERSAIIRRGGF